MKKEISQKIGHWCLFVAILLGSVTFVGAQERVVLRTDRDIYIGGDRIWTSINCFESNTAKPSKASRVIYLELLNESNTPVWQQKVLLKDGFSSTTFSISDTLSTGNYLIRAYSSWMKNEGVTNYATKLVSIINPFSKKKFPQSENIFTTTKAFFYPEGGKLLEGVVNQLLIQVVDKQGKGFGTNAVIQTVGGDTVQLVTTDKTGFSMLAFKPEAGKDYQLVLANKTKLPLPASYSSAVALHLKELGGSEINFQILKNGADSVTGMAMVHIVTPEGRFIAEKELAFANGNEVAFETKSLPSGILTAYLISPSKKLLSSRMFSVNNEGDKNILNISLNKSKFKERERVDLSLLKDDELSNLSVSVLKSCLKDDYLRLKYLQPTFTSDFIHAVGVASLTANELLQTITPNKSFWANESGGLFVPEPYNEVLEGTLLDKTTGKPIGNESLLLSFVSSQPSLYLAVTDSIGHFRLEVDQNGEREMVIQPLKWREQVYNYSVELDNSFSKDYSFTCDPLAVSVEQMDRLNQCVVNTQIMSWFDREAACQEVDSISLPFYNKAEFVVPIEKFIELPTMEEVFREIVPMTLLRKKEGKFQIRVVGDDVDDYDSTLVLVDGVPVRDHNEIFKIVPSDVLRIEVLNADYYMNKTKLGPIVSVVTNKANLSAMDLDPRIFRQARVGYAEKWHFEGFDYSVDSIKESRMPDFRNTLYWNPNVDFGELNQVQLSFYTADEDADYEVVVEGVDYAGELVRRILFFSVSR